MGNMDSESVNTMDSAALVEKLSESRIAIYGTGYAADNFYRALQIRGLERKAICFAQTCTDEEKELLRDCRSCRWTSFPKQKMY